LALLTSRSRRFPLAPLADGTSTSKRGCRYGSGGDRYWKPSALCVGNLAYGLIEHDGEHQRESTTAQLASYRRNRAQKMNSIPQRRLFQIRSRPLLSLLRDASAIVELPFASPRSLPTRASVPGSSASVGRVSRADPGDAGWPRAPAPTIPVGYPRRPP